MLLFARNVTSALVGTPPIDPNAEYVKHWLPELEPLSTEYAHHPWRMSDAEQTEYGVRLGLDYPTPILDPDERYDEMR